MLHTIIPEEVVFDGLINKSNYKLKEIDYKGKKLLVQENEKGYKVERLLSTDVNDYLNTKFTPGSIIRKN